ncbi:MAG: transcriptional initiation protein Tat [Acidobacteria bacterium]|nr:MAG: transcriptional initiation protein Tat [Acidobacteriota bacterium]
MTLDRRQALRALAFGGVGALAAPSWAEKLAELARDHAEAHMQGLPAAAAEAAVWKPKVFDPHQNDTVVTLSELIIPQTETPGARAARVNELIDLVLSDAEERDRKEFLKGLAWMDARSQELFGTDFLSAAPEQQTALLTILASPRNKAFEDQVGIDFFKAIKALTITGYYTSEIGMKQELGDDGQLFLLEYPGCTHPEHKA